MSTNLYAINVRLNIPEMVKEISCPLILGTQDFMNLYLNVVREGKCVSTQ